MTPRWQDASAGVLTVARGMQVLRAFRSDRASLSNAELVRRTGLSKADGVAPDQHPAAAGRLRHVPGGREFELGAAPVGIGHAYLAGSDLLERANPFLQDLADRLNVSVALAIRDDLEMLYLGYRVGHKVATLRLGLGSVLPMGTTSIGHAYLWGLPPAERAAADRGGAAFLWRRRGPGRSGHAAQASATWKAPAPARCSAGYQRDAYGVALPVRVGRRGIVMGLSCGKADMQPDLAAEQRRIAPVLRKAADEFEQLMADFDGEP